jgi:electron transfer flavoprotein beta subunit
MKYVIDPEILSRDFALDPATGLPTTIFPSFQFDQYDRIALEIALNFRKAKSGAKVISVCTGPDAAQDRLRDTLALGADSAVLIETAQPLNDYDRAAVFAGWARTQDFSIILCGRMTSDTDSSEVGPLLAEMLGRPLIVNVVRIEERDGRIACKREVGEGYEWIFVEGPFVATATNAPDNNARKAKLQDVMRAQRLPIDRVPTPDHLQTKSGRGLKTLRAYMPSVIRVCHRIEGADAAEKAAELSHRLLPLLDQKFVGAHSPKALS